MPSAATLALLTALAAPVLGAWAGAALAEDRYGPPHPVDIAAPAAEPASGWLNWSAKTAPAQPAQPAPAAERVVTAEPAPIRPIYRAPTSRAPTPDRLATAALPTSLYGSYPSLHPRPAAPTADAPAPARWAPASQAAAPPAPAAAASPTNQAPHFYSVHREFGLKPDPIPLPQQFFAASASADLAAPPPPLDPHPVPGTQAATSPANTAANRAREVELETADSANN